MPRKKKKETNTIQLPLFDVNGNFLFSEKKENKKEKEEEQEATII